MKERFNELLELVKEATNNYSAFGIVTFVIDVIITIFLLIFIIHMLRIKLKQKKVIVFFVCAFALLVIAYFLNLNIVLWMLKYVGFWSLGLIIIIYNQELRHIFDSNLHENMNSRTFSSEGEKKHVIDILVNTAVYLSERRTGALITIEGKDSLDSIIDKSIIINSDISQELLTTLFYVGTVTHDGAVIIRKNVIKCAGAYLPSTDRYDIPKTLGTRHRAAIGISERCDAITIVVSEETGNISVTVNGGIEIGISAQKLREMLEQYLIVK